MSVKYNIVERGKPGHPEAGTKFYPSIQSSEHHIFTPAIKAYFTNAHLTYLRKYSFLECILCLNRKFLMFNWKLNTFKLRIPYV